MTSCMFPFQKINCLNDLHISVNLNMIIINQINANSLQNQFHIKSQKPHWSSIA